MTSISLFIAAIAPGIALLAYFYLKDRYVTEPLGMVIKMFVVGVLIVFPIMVLQRGFFLWLGHMDWVTAFIISAGLEEFFKWFIIYFYIFKHKVFDEPYDGIVYAVAVSLGFATFENVIYTWSMPITVSGLIFRALLPVSAHALFAVVMGYYFGNARFSKADQRAKLLLYALLIPILWHGLYDYILQSSNMNWIWLMVPLMAGLWILGMWKVNRANERSPYRVMYRDDDLEHPL